MSGRKKIESEEELNGKKQVHQHRIDLVWMWFTLIAKMCICIGIFCFIIFILYDNTQFRNNVITIITENFVSFFLGSLSTFGLTAQLNKK